MYLKIYFKTNKDLPAWPPHETVRKKVAYAILEKNLKSLEKFLYNMLKKSA